MRRHIFKYILCKITVIFAQALFFHRIKGLKVVILNLVLKNTEIQFKLAFELLQGQGWGGGGGDLRLMSI